MDTAILTTIFLNLWLWAGIVIGACVLLFFAFCAIFLIIGIVRGVKNQ